MPPEIAAAAICEHQLNGKPQAVDQALRPLVSTQQVPIVNNKSSHGGCCDIWRSFFRLIVPCVTEERAHLQRSCFDDDASATKPRR